MERDTSSNTAGVHFFILLKNAEIIKRLSTTSHFPAHNALYIIDFALGLAAYALDKVTLKSLGFGLN
jgi:hypothetical protein